MVKIKVGGCRSVEQRRRPPQTCSGTLFAACVWQIGVQECAVDWFVWAVSHSGPTLQQLISLTGAIWTRGGWANLTVADHRVRQTGLVTRASLFQFPSSSWWKVGGQMSLSHLSTTAVEVFLSKVLKPTWSSAQRPSVDHFTVTEPWSPSMPASAWMQSRERRGQKRHACSANVP